MNIPVAFSFAIAFALANAAIHNTIPLTATAAITAAATTATSIKVHPLWISHTHFAEFLFNTFNWIYFGFFIQFIVPNIANVKNLFAITIRSL